jgi:hypothetical protein
MAHLMMGCESAAKVGERGTRSLHRVAHPVLWKNPMFVNLNLPEWQSDLKIPFSSIYFAIGKVCLVGLQPACFHAFVNPLGI